MDCDFPRLRNGKIYVEKDGIEYGVAEDLIEAGVSREDIVYDFDSLEPPKESDQAAA